MRKVEVVDDPLATGGGGAEIEAGDEIDDGVDIVIRSPVFFSMPVMVSKKTGIEVAALDELVEVAVAVVAVALP